MIYCKYNIHVYKNLLEPKDWNPLEVGAKSPLKLLSMTHFAYSYPRKSM